MNSTLFVCALSTLWFPRSTIVARSSGCRTCQLFISSVIEICANRKLNQRFLQQGPWFHKIGIAAGDPRHQDCSSVASGFAADKLQFLRQIATVRIAPSEALLSIDGCLPSSG